IDRWYSVYPDVASARLAPKPRVPVHDLIFFMSRHPLSSTLFPYTTLFRSSCPREEGSTPMPAPIADRAKALDAALGQIDRQFGRSEEHTSELQSRENLVCRLLLEKKKKKTLAEYDRKHQQTHNRLATALSI